MQHQLHHESRARRLALLAFEQASAALAGRRPAGMPDWLDRGALRSVALPLPLPLPLPGAGAPVLQLGLRPGWSPAAFPRQWLLPGSSQALALRYLPADAMAAQGLPTLSPGLRPGFEGSATALLQDSLSPSRYLLTCGHVAAPMAQAREGDRVGVSGVAGAAGLSARLRNWQPRLGEGAYRTTIDAALLALDGDLYDALRAQADLLPAGVAATGPTAGQALTLRRRGGTQSATALVYWSGDVDIPGYTPGEADYFLERAIGYRCAVATQGGDSGAAVWDAQDHLCGMHLAGLVNASSDAAAPNAVFGPIQPVLDWFSVSPVLRGGRVAAAASPPAAATRSTTAAASAVALSAREVVAATLWGEARNQGERGMRAVACVVANRARTQYRHCEDARAVCLDPQQFSCWNAGDPNRARMLAVLRQPDASCRQALSLADELLAGNLTDITRNARHYHTSATTAYWAHGKRPCAVIGDHLFYNDVA